jgi:hypothetical protein
MNEGMKERRGESRKKFISTILGSGEGCFGRMREQVLTFRIM